MKTAAIKWKEFKAGLKKNYYDPSLDKDELLQLCDDRVHTEQWKWLVEHWMSPEANV